jgi:hypothetical protein
MRHTHKWLSGLLVCILLMLVLSLQAQDITPTPTMTLTPTATITPTSTPTPSTTPTPTLTYTATSTSTLLPTPLPSSSATSSATATPNMIVVTAPPVVVTLPVIITATPLVITSPPATAPPAPANNTSSGNTTTRAQPVVAPTQRTPFYGWRRYESIHLIEVVGRWRIRQHPSASSQQYRQSEAYGATVRYPFQGDGIRVAYLMQEGGCRFDVILDGVVQETIDSHSDASELYWQIAGAYFLAGGYHVLDIRAHNDRPCVTAIDYMDIFTNAPMPVVPTTIVGNQNANGVTDTGNERDITQITLLSEPATSTAQPTAVPMGRVQLQVQIAIDKNANGEADLDEGVQAVSVRLVDADSGALIASAFTDQRGRVTFDVSANSDVVAHVPLLAETFRLRVRAGDVVEERWSLLLAGANQPAVMP